MSSLRWIMCVASLAVAWTALLASSFAGGPGSAPPTSVDGAFVDRISSWTGAKAIDRQMRELGTVEELVIEPTTGRIEFAAILLLPPAGGQGERLYAVPWTLGKPAAATGGRAQWNLTIGAAKFDKAPSFAKEQWPDLADPAFADAIHKHYGTTRLPEIRAVGPQIVLARARELVRKQVRTIGGEHAGTVDDLVVDPHAGRMNYLVLAVATALELEHPLIPVAWPTVKTLVGSAQEPHLLLSVDADKLAAAPAYDATDWIKMSDAAWVREMWIHPHAPPYWSASQGAVEGVDR